MHNTGSNLKPPITLLASRMGVEPAGGGARYICPAYTYVMQSNLTALRKAYKDCDYTIVITIMP